MLEFGPRVSGAGFRGKGLDRDAVLDALGLEGRQLGDWLAHVHPERLQLLPEGVCVSVLEWRGRVLAFQTSAVER